MHAANLNQHNPPVRSFMEGPAAPRAGSEAEIALFKQLQLQLAHQFEHAFPDPLAPKTVVILPSLTLDQEILQRIDGIEHYEERLLCMLMLLRMPRTHLVYLTSIPLDPVIIDYYLHLLPGITGYHARQRLTMLSCFDASPVSLTQKVLDRPRLIERIRTLIPAGHAAHMACFNVTPLERTLAVKLNIPIYGCDPDLIHMANKSNGRKLFRAAGLKVPDGFEDLRTEVEMAEALAALRLRHPGLHKAVVKINEGFSGEGNAVFRYPEHMADAEVTPRQMLKLLPHCLQPISPDLSLPGFLKKFAAYGGIVEVFVEGEEKASPSVQCRIDPMGGCDIISTHDQVLGGHGNQVYLGAYFPAQPAYAAELARICQPLMQAMRHRGVIGRFGVDFVSVKNKQGKWEHYAIEINLRKGGTTHPFLMLKFLTEGTYHADAGKFKIKTGQVRHYFSTDNLMDERYRGLTPHDLIEIATDQGLIFNGTAQEGVMFHMIGALSQYGKLGVLCVGKSKQGARRLYERTRQVLLQACGG
jgi:hypothetical protein